jgi:hypothetical protein
MAGSSVVKTLLSEADRLKVAQTVHDRKSFAVLQHTRTVIRQRRSGEDIKLILNLDDIFQN